MFNHQDASVEEQQNQIAVSIEQAETIVKTRDQILKLSKNKDFKAIFTDGYFVDEAARLASIYGSPRLTEKENQDVHNQILAIGALRRYLLTKQQMGDAAETELEYHRETQSELNAVESLNESDDLVSYIPE